MIDIHCHILPGLDDGAAGTEEALTMAGQATREGITDLIATPHSHNGVYHNRPGKIRESVFKLQRELDKNRIPLKIHPGSEVHIHYELMRNITEDRLITLCDSGKYILIELPCYGLPVFTDQLFRSLLKEGKRPVIAHPERSLSLQENPDKLKNWINLGVIAQITAGSLLGSWGQRARYVSVMWVKRGIVQLMGSDCHNSTVRPAALAQAYKFIEKKASRRIAENIYNNAWEVLRGKDL